MNELRRTKGQLPPLDEVLGKLPWFHDLTVVHRREMLDQVSAHLSTDTSRQQYAAMLERWADMAHVDAKRTRLRLLRESGLLAS